VTWYARSRHVVTIHLATHQDPYGPALCGRVPWFNAWFGPDAWQFFDELPASEGAWASADPTSLLCRRCERARKRVLKLVDIGAENP